MDLPTAQHQEIGTHNSSAVEKMMVCQNSKAAQEQMRKVGRPTAEQALKCPRCDSTNTKFCYYNNYSLSQPRYFCKSCRRYWTQGGTLRNVPVGGGCRKNNKRSSSSKRPQDPPGPFPLPPLSYDHHTNNDLALAFARLHKNSNSNSNVPAFNDFDFSVFGMPNADDGAAFGYNSHPHGLYYGDDDDNNNMNNMNNMNMGSGIENSSGGDPMRVQPYDQGHPYSNATTTAVTVTTMKQEIMNNNDNEITKTAVWGYGYPNWQMNHNNNNNGDHSNMMTLDHLDSAAARETSWIFNNNTSSWHALLNTPLM